MTLITFQDGQVVMRDGQVGTEQACCCQECAPCPDLESLCISITLTDYNGTAHTADQDDIIWSGGSGFIYFKDFEYVMFLSCDIGNTQESIGAVVGWGGLIDGCESTSGEGSDALPCSTAPDWYVGTVFGEIEFSPPSGGCPGNAGSFSVTFADPPC